MEMAVLAPRWPMNVLVLNAGSSSLKFQLIATDLARIQSDADERVCRGLIERIGGEAVLTIQNAGEEKHKSTAPLKNIMQQWNISFARLRQRWRSMPLGTGLCMAASSFRSR